jgi:hypothetical protein
MRRAAVLAIQNTLKDSLPCTELVADCPAATRDLFGVIPAVVDKASFIDYTDYIMQVAGVDLIQRAYLAYYNQGIRTFYHELIVQSDAGGHLHPDDGANLFNTVFEAPIIAAYLQGNEKDILRLLKMGIHLQLM